MIKINQAIQQNKITFEENNISPIHNKKTEKEEDPQTPSCLTTQRKPTYPPQK